MGYTRQITCRQLRSKVKPINSKMSVSLQASLRSKQSGRALLLHSMLSNWVSPDHCNVRYTHTGINKLCYQYADPTDFTQNVWRKGGRQLSRSMFYKLWFATTLKVKKLFCGIRYVKVVMLNCSVSTVIR
jgi:hypothetical protein